jgi:hypothetical protein
VAACTYRRDRPGVLGYEQSLLEETAAFALGEHHEPQRSASEHASPSWYRKGHEAKLAHTDYEALFMAVGEQPKRAVRAQHTACLIERPERRRGCVLAVQASDAHLRQAVRELLQ